MPKLFCIHSAITKLQNYFQKSQFCKSGNLVYSSLLVVLDEMLQFANRHFRSLVKQNTVCQEHRHYPETHWLKVTTQLNTRGEQHNETKEQRGTFVQTARESSMHKVMNYQFQSRLSYITAILEWRCISGVSCERVLLVGKSKLKKVTWHTCTECVYRY